MRKNWIALPMALALAVTLTACSNSDNKGGGTAGSAGGSDNGPSSGTTGQTGYSYTGRTGYGPYGASGGPDQRSAGQWPANDYLNDGRYTAGDDGQVMGGGDSAGRDLTQGARDMIRGAGDAVEDVGDGIRNATRDVLDY